MSFSDENRGFATNNNKIYSIAISAITPLDPTKLSSAMIQFGTI